LEKRLAKLFFDDGWGHLWQNGKYGAAGTSPDMDLRTYGEKSGPVRILGPPLSGFFAMRGPAVPTNVEPSGVTLLDIAPTICHLMEVAIPPSMEGNVLIGKGKK